MIFNAGRANENGPPQGASRVRVKLENAKKSA